MVFIDMERNVLETIRQYNMLQQEDSVILGISGGADSLCLLIVLKKLSDELKLKLAAVHVNHHIRGKEADRDQHFVEEMCSKLGVDLSVVHIDANKLAKEMKCSCEEAGRIARYEIFEKERVKNGCNHIAVAHNKNDSVETMLFNLARGTGIKGLTGISPVRGSIIRPLIGTDRKSIEEYLKKENVGYCVDSTNLTDEYSRNVIRNNVIPLLSEKINSAVVDNISRAGDELSRIEDYLDLTIEEAYKKYVTECFVNENIKCEHDVVISGVIRKVIEGRGGRLKDITRTHIDDVKALLYKPVSKKINLPYDIVAERKYEGIEFVIKSDCNRDDETERIIDEEITLWDGNCHDNPFIELMQLKYDKNVPQDLLYTKQIDCDKIKNRLVIRNRKEGDYILIRGSRGETVKKKLKQFFVDEKVPRKERDRVMLVADESSIVWIVGYRLSEGYKLDENTGDMLKMRLK